LDQSWRMGRLSTSGVQAFVQQKESTIVYKCPAGYITENKGLWWYICCAKISKGLEIQEGRGFCQQVYINDFGVRGYYNKHDRLSKEWERYGKGRYWITEKETV
jgi:hypothetical protein